MSDTWADSQDLVPPELHPPGVNAPYTAIQPSSHEKLTPSNSCSAHADSRNSTSSPALQGSVGLQDRPPLNFNHWPPTFPSHLALSHHIPHIHIESCSSSISVHSLSQSAISIYPETYHFSPLSGHPPIRCYSPDVMLHLTEIADWLGGAHLRFSSLWLPRFEPPGKTKV
jgi:hypothetical protein